ncbi:MAG: hypothetical protein WC378_14075 [Opitutaceae bacterium]|jgi:hypothetical protein
MITSKTSTIRHEAELAREFADLVAHDTRIEQFTLNSPHNPTEARLRLDGRQFRFALKFLLTSTVEALPSASANGTTHPLLVVPRLTPAFLQACRQNGTSVADLNGQLFLRGSGLLVSLPGLPDRDFRFGQEPRNVFVGKSARIVRTLLSDPEHTWQQAELIKRTGATSGLVSRIVTYFTRQGLLKKTDARRFHIVSPLALLDAWTQADDFSRRATTYRFAVLNNDPVRLAMTIGNVLAHGGLPFAFTQWIAAWLRHPYTEPAIVSLYVRQLPTQDLLDQLGLQPELVE